MTVGVTYGPALARQRRRTRGLLRIGSAVTAVLSAICGFGFWGLWFHSDSLGWLGLSTVLALVSSALLAAGWPRGRRRTAAGMLATVAALLLCVLAIIPTVGMVVWGVAKLWNPASF